MKRLLRFDPQQRLTVEEALRHPYVSQFHNPKTEQVCNKIISIPLDDDKKFSIKEYRHMIYAHIQAKRRELRKKAHMKLIQDQKFKKSQKENFYPGRSKNQV